MVKIKSLSLKPMWIVYIGGVVSLIGTFEGSSGISATMVVIGTIITITGTLLQQERSSEKTDKLSSDLEIARSENRLLNQRLSNSLLGTDSYCFVYFMILPGNDLVYPRLYNIGEHAIRNVQYRIVNLDDILNIVDDFGLTPEHEQALHRFKFPLADVIPILSSKEEMALQPFPIQWLKEKAFNVAFRADNGNKWYQRVVMRRIEDYPEFHSAYPKGASKDAYFSATQIYELRYGYFSTAQDSEIMLFEGVQMSARGDFGSSTQEEMWKNFPLMPGEQSPFEDKKAHFDGNSISGYNLEGLYFKIDNNLL